MVVEALRPKPPLVYLSTTTFGPNMVLRREVLGDEAMSLAVVSEQGQTSRIARGNGETGMDERLPVVGVVEQVADRVATDYGGDAPVEPDAVATFAPVLAEGHRRRTDEAPMAGHEDGCVR